MCFTAVKPPTLILIIEKMRIPLAKASHTFFNKNIGVFQLIKIYFIENLTKR